MTATKYEKRNAEFSNAVHNLAQALVYPKLFSAEKESIVYEEDTLLGESIRGDILDGEMGIDRVLRVTVPGLNGRIPFTVQERFRRPAFVEWQDLTITEWNYASNLPSELYKIRANIFLYGYANAEENPTGFIEVIAVDMTLLLLKIAKKEIEYRNERNTKDQSFLGFRFTDLENAGVVIFHDKSFSNPVVTAAHLVGKYNVKWINELVRLLNKHMKDAQNSSA